MRAVTLRSAVAASARPAAPAARANRTALLALVVTASGAGVALPATAALAAMQDEPPPAPPGPPPGYYVPPETRTFVFGAPPPDPAPPRAPGNDRRWGPGSAPARAAATAFVAPPAEPSYGFLRDKQGRLMQISFDFDRRLWLGVAYAPRRLPTGETHIAPAAFDFGGAYDTTSDDGRTRHRLRFMTGEARLNPFGLDVTALHYDLSHRYDTPVLKVTNLIGEPTRHDLFLNIGFFAEALHFDVAPRGVSGEYLLTLGTAQATLDLWQSADLRSFFRLRVGPALDMRLGPWGDETRLVGILPESTLEGRFVIGRRGLHQLGLRAQGQFLRSLTLEPQPLGSTWLASGEAAWEWILIAINDQPVSLRVAGRAGLRETDAETPAGTPATDARTALDWSGTVGFRMSFFSPPVPPGR